MSTRLILIRHGETCLSLKRAYYGKINTRLTSKGISQAKRLMARFKNETIHKAYSSDLKRASDFAKTIFYKLPIEKTPALRELDFGIFEGLTHRQIMKKHPREYKSWLNNPYTARIPKGENMRAFEKRVLNFVKTVVLQTPGKTIAIISHAGPIRIILNNILKTRTFPDVGRREGGTFARAEARSKDDGVAGRALRRGRTTQPQAEQMTSLPANNIRRGSNDVWAVKVDLASITIINYVNMKPKIELLNHTT